MLILPAYAKLNLALEVVGRREGGWHELESVVVTIDWHDVVGVALCEEEGVALRITGTDVDGVPGGASNLAHRAARAMTDHLHGRGASVWLEKRLPHGAGLGGGSADAAAVLRGLSWLLARTGQPAARPVDAIALELGSDVPVLLAGGAQHVRGRGEILEPAPCPPLDLVVVTAGRSSTRDTFNEVRREEWTSGERVERLRAALAGGRVDPTLLGSALEPAACRAQPSLGRAIDRVRSMTPDIAWHLTGSGGAVFSVASDAASAATLAAAMRAESLPARACRTVLARATF